MKTSELIKILKASGKCKFIGHGKKHDEWYSEITDTHFYIPRHAKEMKKGTANQILKDAGLR